MKAISIRQPWASMIAAGVKTIELRSWPTEYRGDVLICAAKTTTAVHKSLPRGVSLCMARIADCRPYRPADAQAACSEWRPGEWAFVLEDIRPVPHVPVKGQLWIFSAALDPESLRAIERALPPGQRLACTPAA